jgi:3-deoxy-D-manno-octulosonate 8-phosphate phosphatase (KDO 8-P phosphatase)
MRPFFPRRGPDPHPPTGPGAGEDVRERAAAVRLLVLDVDGVLTDGSLLLGPDGVEHKRFHVRDGLGVKLLREAGVEVAAISGRRAPVVEERMASLGVRHVFQGSEDKLPVFRSLLDRLGLEPGSAAAIGDDLPDLPVLLNAGLAVAVADAHPRLIEHAHWVTPSAGGRGAVRELCELILAAHGALEAAEGPYLAGPV